MILFLILPDGSVYEITSADHHGNGLGTEYTYRLTFPALSAEVMEVTLVIPRIVQIPPGQGPENWLLPLRFVAGNAEDLQRVFEIEAPDEEENFSPKKKTENQQNPDPSISNISEGNPFGISFNLDHVVELDNGYQLMTETVWQDPSIEPWGVLTNLEHITDTNGKVIPFDYVQPDRFPAEDDHMVYNSFQIDGYDFAWPLTLSVKFMQVRVKTDAAFSFDAGQDPPTGKIWIIDQNIPVGAYILHIDSVEVIAAQDGSPALLIRMDSPDIVSAFVFDPGDPEAASGGGGGNGYPDQGPYQFESRLTYTALPQGPVTLKIDNITVFADGPWQITWQPE